MRRVARFASSSSVRRLRDSRKEGECSFSVIVRPFNPVLPLDIMNAKAHATLFPAPRLVPLRPRDASHLVRRANKPYLKARREAEASLWTRRQNRADAVTRPVATRPRSRGAPAPTSTVRCSACPPT